jgi:nucleoside phosphorylase
MKEFIDLIKRVSTFKTESEELFGTTHKKNKSHLKQVIEIGIITATPDEFQSIKSLLIDVEKIEIENDDSITYYNGVLSNESKSFKIIIPYPLEMGIPSVVNATTKVISNFHPKYLFMVGIAAGNKNVNNIGDILIAEKSINYNEVVEIEKKDKTTMKKFMQNSDSINKYFKTLLSQFSNSTLIKEIQDDYPKKAKIEQKLKCKMGMLVTGNSLVRSQTKVDEINQSYHNVVGLDMETNGFYFSAAHTLKMGVPYFVSLKSVSDFGDNSSHKLTSDERRHYALYTSANALKQFILNYL